MVIVIYYINKSKKEYNGHNIIQPLITSYIKNSQNFVEFINHVKLEPGNQKVSFLVPWRQQPAEIEPLKQPKTKHRV